MIKDDSETEKKYLVIAGFVEVGEKIAKYRGLNGTEEKS